MSEWVTPVVVVVAVAMILFIATLMPSKEEAPTAPAVPRRKNDAQPSERPADSAPDSIKTITVEARPEAKDTKNAAGLPKIDYEEDADVDPTLVGRPAKAKTSQAVQPPTKRIVYDVDALPEEQTKPGALILVTATAQTDKGIRRKRNEDSLLALEEAGVYVVADGMGGYRGGEVASDLAVRSIEEAFAKDDFPGEPHANIPRRASDLARAIQRANERILAHASTAKELEGMGTTICAARFSPNKQRLYVAHVGDSRLYRFRDGELRQMTSDHTMKDLGVTGEGASHLSRAVGVWPVVPIDILLAKPLPGDVYVLCSDGLTKMLSDEAIARVLAEKPTPKEVVEKLIASANDRGGKDNITVIVVRVFAPGDVVAHSKKTA